MGLKLVPLPPSKDSPYPRYELRPDYSEPYIPPKKPEPPTPPKPTPTPQPFLQYVMHPVGQAEPGTILPRP